MYIAIVSAILITVLVLGYCIVKQIKYAQSAQRKKCAALLDQKERICAGKGNKIFYFTREEKIDFQEIRGR